MCRQFVRLSFVFTTHIGRRSRIIATFPYNALGFGGCHFRRCETVPTANLNRLTATANRLILAPDERSLQVDLVRLDRTVPVAGCLGSRDPCPLIPAQRVEAQISESIGLQQR